MRSLRYIVCALFCIAASSCVFTNDMDYPSVPGNVISFAVEGQKEVDIDNTARTVTVKLNETADISRLKVEDFTVSPEAEVIEPFGEYIDLRAPLKIILRTYQDYEWTIKAVQPIERYVNCENQVGEALFNLEEKSVIVKVTDFQPLASLVINSMKLEPEGSVVQSTTGFKNEGGNIVETTVDCDFPMTLDCILERKFNVLYKGEVVVWKFKAIQIETKAAIVSVRPWCYHAKVRATFSGTGKPVIEYKKASDSQWITVENITVAGVGVTADIQGLSENSEYTVRIKEGKEYGTEYSFSTDNPVQLYNMSFDEWHSEGKTWYPYPDGATEAQKVWDSANKATGTFIGSATTPEEDFVAVKGEGKKAAKLKSSFAVVKFAAGSIFVGEFVGLKGLGAELAWGVPFSSRPSCLKGYYSYSPAVINYSDKEHEDLKGKEDNAHVIVILTDWDAPFHVLSAEKKFVDFKNDPAIIGYGKLQCENTGKVYKDFSVNIEYRSDRIPKWVSIIASSSSLGDYFTGGDGSILYLDEFSFVYE